MKSLIVVFLFLAVVSYSQDRVPYHNPDGDKISFHLQTYVTTGNGKIAQTKPYDYLLGFHDTVRFKVVEDQSLSFNFMVKIPTTRNLTIIPFYSYDSLTYEVEVDYQYHYLSRIGVQFSYYMD
ncbi:hypothetical protein ACFLS9_07785 [Bacteroidota bacterium]